MQKITVLCVGKLKEKFYLDATAEYAKRLGRYCKLDILELPESRLPEEPSPPKSSRLWTRRPPPSPQSSPRAGRWWPCVLKALPAPARK